jgi:beta-adrenergic-receptor kinase
MEELQDALEDAQYVNAINLKEGPRPIAAWDDPSEDVLQEWKNQKIKEWTETLKDKEEFPKPFTFEWVLQSALGFFMFAAFVKDSEDHYFHMNFIEEILRWRKSVGSNRGNQIRAIYELCRSVPPRDKETGKLEFPKQRKRRENDLEYCFRGTKLSNDELGTLSSDCLDNDNRDSSIGIKGKVLNDIVTAIEALFLPEDETLEEDHFEISTHSSEYSKMSARKIKSDKNNESLCETHDESNGVSTSSFDFNLYITRSSIRNFCNLNETVFDVAEQIIIRCLHQQYWSSFQNSSEWIKLMNYLWHQDQKVKEEDFFLMRVLGRGGFGLVNACKKGTTGALYAMKIMNKKRIKHKKSVQFALNERACLAAVDSPFVVSLKYAFQTKDNLYLILDLMTGGDLAFHLSKKRRFSHEVCLYYASRIMLGLQAIHDKNYVYRDLKPENLLLAEDGRIRITDLGLATQVVPGLHGAAGTRGYWAPEMLKRSPSGKRISYDQRVDWFSFGCVVAEMISGCNPFRTESALKFGLEHSETKEKALDYSTLYMTPPFESKKYSEESIDLCKRLLDKNPDTRLGSKGCEEIMKHPWFKEVNWGDIISDKQEPPFVPSRDINAASQSEIGTFLEDKNLGKLKDADQEEYKDWDHKRKNAFANEVIDMLIYEKETGVPLVPVSANCCCTVS